MDAICKEGIAVLEREGTDLNEAIEKNPILKNNKSTIYLIKQTVQNSVSSTLVRKAVSNGWSIMYLTPTSVVDYIHKHKLYSNL
jgi:nicotinamide mononucleotide adenylyltransferase